MTKRKGLSGLRLTDWPALFQAAWAAALQRGGLFCKPGKAAHWAASSREKTCKGFGWFLAWLIDRGIAIDRPLPDLVTREVVRAYVAELQATKAGYTPANRVQELYDAVRVMEPEADWSWLEAAMQNIAASAEPVRDKAGRLRPAHEIEALGLRLMAEADDPRTGSRLRQAERYRDGLMIALLIRRPLRNKNFHALILGEHLIKIDAIWTLALDADEMKSKRTFEAALPAHLVTALEHYLAVHRPVLVEQVWNHGARRGVAPGGIPARGRQGCGAPAGDALWISREGTAMAAISVHTAVRRATHKASGAPIPPHWFRDAAVTALVLGAPAAAMASMHILQHADPAVAQDHYNRAQAIDSSRRHADLIAEMMEEDTF